MIKDIEIRINVEILRISEGSQHTAKVRRDVLEDKNRSHISLALCGVQHEVSQGQKGQKRHIVGDQHRTDEGDVNQRDHGCAEVSCEADDLARQHREESNILQRAYNCKHRKQAGKRFPIEVAFVGFVGRHNARGDDRQCKGNAKHGVLLHPF